MFDRDMFYVCASQRWISDNGMGDLNLRELCLYEATPDLPDHWLEAHCRALGGEVVRSDIDRIDRADGTVQWLRWEVRPWRNAKDEVGGVMIFSEDLSDLKRAEDAREKLLTQLYESQKMEALGTLAGGVAHDFNNVLTLIAGNVELARLDVGAGHPALINLDEITKASRRAKDLVRQILAFGRHQPVGHKVMSLVLVMVEMERLIRPSVPPQVTFTMTCEGDAPAVLADANQIMQVLLNLCSNAIQSVEGQAPPGLVEVTLGIGSPRGAENAGNPRSHACITVRDNGAGMDEATRARVFDPFFTTKQKGAGVGLGLSVVHGIVESHNAFIEVDSSPGKGAEFRLYFPEAESLPPSVPRNSAPTNGKHVLYVDDDRAIIFLMQRLLENAGFRVSGYDNPQEAVAAVRADPAQFDLVVTDYNMPVLSGLAVARIVHELRPELPVVLASAFITEEVRAKAPAAGVHKLISKADSAEDLYAAVLAFANTLR